MPETLEILNARLKDHYGCHEGDSTQPNWRVSWSPDQLENRHGEWNDYTDSGIYKRTVTETRLVPKYHYLKPCWMLEALIPVPIIQENELPGTKLSYECIYAFPYRDGKPIFPIWPALHVLIRAVHEKVGKNDGPRYADPMNDPKIAEDVKEERLKELEETLYGNETDIGDALAYKQGVGYTGPPTIAQK